MKYRIQYHVVGNLRFISHSDTARMLGRVFRQIALPLSYSQGFSPHPLLSFSPARAVGISSLCEIVDVVLDQDLEPEEIMEMINAAAPPCFKARSVTRITPADFKLKEIAAAEYIIKYPQNISFSEDKLTAKMSADAITIKKYSSKKGTVEVDVKKYVFGAQMFGQNCIRAKLKVGERNVSPIAFAEYLFDSRDEALASLITRMSLSV